NSSPVTRTSSNEQQQQQQKQSPSLKRNNIESPSVNNSNTTTPVLQRQSSENSVSSSEKSPPPLFTSNSMGQLNSVENSNLSNSPSQSRGLKLFSFSQLINYSCYLFIQPNKFVHGGIDKKSKTESLMLLAEQQRLQ